MSTTEEHGGSSPAGDGHDDDRPLPANGHGSDAPVANGHGGDVANGHGGEEPIDLNPGTEAYRNDPTHFGIDPGEPWPDDVPRNQDDMKWRYQGDPKGARRAELRIAALWTVTMLCGIGLAWVYVVGGQPQVEGTLLAVGFGCLGVGLVLWARDLLPGTDVTASRGHHNVSPATARATVTQSLGRGLEPIARRPFLGKVLGGVLTVFGLGVLFPLASLGPRPKTYKHGVLADEEQSGWKPGLRLVNEDGAPLKPSDIDVDGILTVFPEGNASAAQSSTILINLGSVPEAYAGGHQGYNIGGLVAYSKICTHAGCPVGLYNTQSHQLVCPCHQSTFDVTEGCKPVFGPASRSLPQLPLTTDSEGYLITTSGYTEPVGPGYWNR